MIIKRISIPTPELVVTGCHYCWKCEHKTIGYMTLGDTKQEAIDNFKNSIEAINADSKAGWLRRYNGCKFEFVP